MLSGTALLVCDSKPGGVVGEREVPKEERSVESRGSLERLLEPEGTGKCLLGSRGCSRGDGQKWGKEAQRTMLLFAVLLRAKPSSSLASYRNKVY